MPSWQRCGRRRTKPAFHSGPPFGTVKLSSATSATPIADLDNIYLESLLWLTPTNPFLDPNGTPKDITFAFGAPGSYTIQDPESTVDKLQATAWKTSLAAPAAVTLPN